ncbi:MAG: TetR/AcrR family transcriptional regulator [Methylocystis sp.]|nr:TetR/AcrR family transcriptional regulator [Methylocystis sp.]MCA3582648.1 TetR/AcrR family transcriptional regulator [Methylocystis sp.]MCA3588651.1 TetR/AcrR family transcriptional regulator [Methylocystis sp.]MCA3591679.1 TetR/AcrR family transcriptional regulator [Methylocystis sp.]
MRYKPGHKDDARGRVLAAAGRGFRKNGYAGIGVDGLAKEAGVTSGAFYGHFKSKESAFDAAVAAGFEGLRSSIVRRRAEDGEAWIERYIDFYLDERRTCDLGEGCALQTLTPEIGRGGSHARALYEAGMKGVVAEVASGLSRVPEAERETRAWALLSLLAGAVTVARAMADDGTGRQVADAARMAARKLVLATPG